MNYLLRMNSIYAISEPKRAAIISLLARRGALSAGEICDEFDISAPAVSQHLKVLRDANLVEVKINAQKRIYSIKRDGLDRIENWVHELKQQMEGALDRLELFLAQGKDLDS